LRREERPKVASVIEKVSDKKERPDHSERSCEGRLGGLHSMEAAITAAVGRTGCREQGRVIL
jgi:hypothetical protein